MSDTKSKFIMFGGKGGVGKTTCATATAVAAAGFGKKTLLFSTDPAHSLSDSLGQQIGGSIRKIEGLENLWAIEINSEEMLRVIKEEFRNEIVRMLTTTTYLDEQDVASVFSLTIPGLDELMGLKQIIDFIEEDDYDLYIWDTAPTGHTLRLLSLPEVLNDWIRVLARMQWKYRQMLTQLMRKDFSETDRDGDFLLSWKKTITKVQKLLKEPGKNRFVAVTIPEAMAVNETRRMYKTLQENGIAMKHILVNNLIPENDSCNFCRSRRNAQQKYVQEIRREFESCNVTEVSLHAQEVKGIETLKEFANTWARMFTGF